MADTSKITLGQLKTALTQAKNYTDNEIAGVTGATKVEPEELDMPKVFFYGTALPTTKDNVNLTMDYVSNTTKFSSFVKLKCQGTSSMSYAKKNFTVAMFSDEARTTKLKKDFKGWGAQSKFCLKANYVDTTHTRNISGARIACDMVNSRPDSPFKQQLLQCPRNGAVDGFPIKLYFNGEFYGIYTWNIPKDGWMFNMDKGNPNHMVLCAEKNNDSTNTSDDILRCEFRKEWDGTDGNSWSIEFGTYSDALKNSFNRCVNFVMTATDEEFKANIGNYFDLYSLLDYYCFTYFVAHIDGLGKNMLMVTYDGTIWGASLYDMDSIYGADWNGTSFKAANLQCPEQYQETNSLLWQRIENCFSAELYARYLELRKEALSLSNIIKHVEEIYDVIPDRVFADEKAKWTSLPQVNTNTITRFRNYMRDRAVYVDAEMLEIGTKVPCTGIVLSSDALSFTTTDTQTLSVVVSPENCTDEVTWSASPTGIVTVVDGVVTPVSNGEATVTATCGSYSDTCSVTVSLPNVECTGITLDKTELALGVVEGGATDDSNKNYLENVAWELGTLNGDTTQYSLANSSADYRCQLTDLPVGTYTLHHDTYTYKKVGLNDNGITLVGTAAKGAPSTNDVTFNITNPNTTVDISVFPNGVTPSGVTLTRTDISDIQEYSIEYTATGSPSWAGSVDNNYLVIEFIVGSNTDVDKNKLVNICIDNDKYYISNPFITDTNDITTLSDKCYSSEYQNNIYTSIALPKSKYGNTLDEFKTYCSNNGITNIYFNKDIQSIGKTLSAQLTATVTPEGCTQPVVWTVSPEGIATVDNGLVTAVTNGEATVTATCGTQSATCAVTVSGMSESGGGTEGGANPNLVFQVNNASMNTVNNTLIDNIAGISATLTGNPTISGNQIAFTADNTFSFDISSLNLTNSNRTFRIKFTPTTLDENLRNVIGLGTSNTNWLNMSTSYANSNNLLLQHGNRDFTNNTVGATTAGNNNNRLSTAPITGQEYELVISENTDGNIRYFIDGTLVQDGTTTLFEPLYLCNTQGNNRFIGNYSLIEIYNEYCNTYEDFTNLSLL